MRKTKTGPFLWNTVYSVGGGPKKWHFCERWRLGNHYWSKSVSKFFDFKIIKA